MTMHRQFFITGLPRSRTAWFAMVCRTSESLCRHEPTADTSSWAELRDWWTQTRPRYRGVSDSGLGLKAKDIINDLSPRTLVIRRPLRDVRDSVNAYLDKHQAFVPQGLLTERLEALDTALDDLRGLKQVKEVDYYDLGSAYVVGECLDWLMPMVPVPGLRELMTFNVQRELSYMMGVSGSTNQWWIPEELRNVA